MNNLLNVSSSPHARSGVLTKNLMWDVVIAMIPASVFGVYQFGIKALLILLVLSTRAYHKHQLALSAQDQELSENQLSAEAERRAALRGTKRVLIKQPEIPGKSTASDGSGSESASNKQPDSETQSTNTNNVITTEQPSETITDKTETQINETAESEEQES